MRPFKPIRDLLVVTVLGASALAAYAAGGTPSSPGVVFRGPANLGAVTRTQNRAIISNIRVIDSSQPPSTAASKMDKPGPVRGPDSYFTIKIGATEVYRDAKDPATAYFCPVIRLGKRDGTPLAENTGSLASSLDGFLFRYIGFDTKGQSYIKYGDVQAVIEAAQPPDVTLDAVRASWKEVNRLIPLPIKLAGVRMRLPYPERVAILSETVKQPTASDPRWCFSTIMSPTPQMLSAGASNLLREAETKDFANAVTADLSDLPAFQPVLEVRALYSGWVGASPQMKVIGPGFFGTGSMQLIRPRNVKPNAGPVVPGVSAAFKLRSSLPADHGAAFSPQYAVYTPGVNDPALRLGAGGSPVTAMRVMRPNAAMRVVGVLGSRQDVDYKYVENQEIVTQIPISYPAGAGNSDYAFYSRDSKRYGWHPEGGLPYEVPQSSTPPDGFAYWYRSHFSGRQIIWPAPNELRLRWNVDKGVQPSCRFYMTGGEGTDPLMAHIEYDLYPNLSMGKLGAAVAAIRNSSGEQVDLRPFTDILSADQMTLVSGPPVLKDLIQNKRLTIQKLAPENVDDAWFTVAVDIPAQDWPSFTIFMKDGALGTWDFGFKQSASSGMNDKVTFALNGDLLQTMGGPLLTSTKNFDSATGGYEVAVTNFGLVPLTLRGMRFQFTGADKQASFDSWFPAGSEKSVPAVPSASSFDSQDGTGQIVEATIKEPASADLKAAWSSGSFQRVDAQLTADMVGSSTTGAAVDPDMAFTYLRSLCYRYAGQSNMIDIPVSPAETSQWLDYKGGRIIVRFQGFVYTAQLDLKAEKNLVHVRRLPKEGAYANWGVSDDLMDKLDYRAVFIRNDGSVVTMPSQDQGPAWLPGDATGILLDMSRIKRVRPVRPGTS